MSVINISYKFSPSLLVIWLMIYDELSALLVNENNQLLHVRLQLIPLYSGTATYLLCKPIDDMSLHF